MGCELGHSPELPHPPSPVPRSQTHPPPPPRSCASPRTPRAAHPRARPSCSPARPARRRRGRRAGHGGGGPGRRSSSLRGNASGAPCPSPPCARAGAARAAADGEALKQHWEAPLRDLGSVRREFVIGVWTASVPPKIGSGEIAHCRLTCPCSELQKMQFYSCGIADTCGSGNHAGQSAGFDGRA
jgi:hypothetical protein